MTPNVDEAADQLSRWVFGENRRALWFYGHNLSSKSELLRQTLVELSAKIPRTFDQVSIIAFRFASSEQGTHETVVDLLHSNEITLWPECAVDSAGAIKTESTLFIPEASFLHFASKSELRKILLDAPAEGHCHRVVVLRSRAGGQQRAVFDLAEISRTTSGIQSAVHKSLSALERAIVQQSTVACGRKQYVPFRATTFTRLTEAWLALPETLNRFVACCAPSTQMKTEALAVCSFACRALTTTAAASRDDSCLHLDSAAVVIQRWFRLQVIQLSMRRLVGQCKKHRVRLAEWEESERNAIRRVFSASRPLTPPHVSNILMPRRPLKPSLRKSDVEVQTSVCVATAGTQATAQGRSRGIQCNKGDEVMDQIVVERDSLRAEVNRLSALLEERSGKNWQYILEKNAMQRRLIEQLQEQLRQYVE